MEDYDFYRERKNICGDRIRMTRKHCRARRKSMTQRELSTRLAEKGCHLSRLAIGRIENGEREISDIELLHIAAVLEVEVNYLLCGDRSVEEVVRVFADGKKTDME